MPEPYHLSNPKKQIIQKLNDTEFTADLSKGIDGPIEMIAGVGSTYLGSNSGGASGHHRE